MSASANKVTLSVSDPWNFGPGPFGGVILSSSGNRPSTLLLRLDYPVLFEGVRCEYFVVSPRGEESDLLTAINQGKSVNCNLTMISEDRANGTDPFDLAMWRGGCALIGNLEANRGHEANRGQTTN